MTKTTNPGISVSATKELPTREWTSLPFDMIFDPMVKHMVTVTYGEGRLLLDHLATLPNAHVVKKIRSEAIDRSIIGFILIQNDEEKCHE